MREREFGPNFSANFERTERANATSLAPFDSALLAIYEGAVRSAVIDLASATKRDFCITDLCPAMKALTCNSRSPTA